MERWILAAEADKIQDLVFRSTHLREVVGGSQMLNRFGEDVTSELKAEVVGGKAIPVSDDPDILVADGGSFSVVFATQAQAEEFGRRLAQAYRQWFNATLTVAPAFRWADAPEGFKTANDTSRALLNRAKRAGRRPLAVEHGPYGAVCASCGISLARMHHSLHEGDRPNYLCSVCRSKAVEDTEKGRNRQFIEAVVGEAAAKVKDYYLLRDTDQAAQGWDPRNYVAYLLADGNSMGKLFGACASPAQIKALSRQLPEALIKSLAVPTQRLVDERAQEYPIPDHRQTEIPVLPLILGGDDVFVRLPAPYALDFARRFCRAYEAEMDKVLRDIGLTGAPHPSIGVAVVVCKATYPHTLAHHHGDHLLKAAKGLAKRAVSLAGADGQAQVRSIINFDVILGSALAQKDAASKAPYRNTLRPYWAGRYAPGADAGLPIDRLIEQRKALAGFPARRLAQFRVLYAQEGLPREDDDKALQRWQVGLEQTLGRIARSPDQSRVITTALTVLGDKEPTYWRFVNRRTYDASYSAQGLPDLLEMWDYCLDLETSRQQYEPTEE